MQGAPWDDSAVYSERERETHRAFLNRYYGISKHFYDWTRKYYLLGRDRELQALARESWSSLLEVGPGTGRNLKLLHRARPSATYGGVEACDEMVLAARKACPFATVEQGFAENAAYAELLGRRPDRILFSYCLSMVQDPKRAIDQALSELAPGGQLVVVDFADFGGLPSTMGMALRQWLRTFHVHPVSPENLRAWGFELSFGGGRYYLRARWRATSQADSVR